MRRSDLDDLGRLQTLRTLGHLELNCVPLGEALEAVTLDRRVVDEEVLALLPRDEPVALGVVEPLDFTALSHRCSLRGSCAPPGRPRRPAGSATCPWRSGR